MTHSVQNLWRHHFPDPELVTVDDHLLCNCDMEKWPCHTWLALEMAQAAEAALDAERARAAALVEMVVDNQWTWPWDDYEAGTVVGLCRFDCHARGAEGPLPERVPIVTKPHDDWCVVTKVLANPDTAALLQRQRAERAVVEAAAKYKEESDAQDRIPVEHARDMKPWLSSRSALWQAIDAYRASAAPPAAGAEEE